MAEPITLLTRTGDAQPPVSPGRPLDDHYRTPPECARALASVVDLTSGVHECCAGDGTMAAALADVLGETAVVASTLYPPHRTFYPIATGVDVLKLDRPLRHHVVTNPPFGRLYGRRVPQAGAATRIIVHALELLATAGEGGLLCCLLDLRYCLSEGRNQPGALLHEYPPSVIHAFQNRVTMYPPWADRPPGTAGPSRSPGSFGSRHTIGQAAPRSYAPS